MAGDKCVTVPRLFRSVLFAPANHPRRAEKVFLSDADVAILDLEDAVAVSEKDAARPAAVALLKVPRTCAGYVRINGVGSPWFDQDLTAVVGPWVDGVVLPKTESAADLHAVDARLTELERACGLKLNSIDLLPLVETARGIMALETIAPAVPRVRRLAFGGGDYSLDLDLKWSFEESEFAYARARLVHCSRVAGLEAPIDTVLLDIKDNARFTSSATRARGHGFQGKLCIHPDQVPLANSAFAPSASDIDRAAAIVQAFTAAEKSGAASITVAGQFVDYPVVYQAERVLAIARRLGLYR